MQHKFCFWHILENIKKNLNSYLAARGAMGNQLRYVIRNAFTPAEFEETWSAILKEHDAERNTYLQQLYGIRNLWAPAYFKDKLYPFSSTTGRSESTTRCSSTMFYGKIQYRTSFSNIKSYKKNTSTS